MCLDPIWLTHYSLRLNHRQTPSKLLLLLDNQFIGKTGTKRQRDWIATVNWWEICRQSSCSISQSSESFLQTSLSQPSPHTARIKKLSEQISFLKCCPWKAILRGLLTGSEAFVAVLATEQRAAQGSLCPAQGTPQSQLSGHLTSLSNTSTFGSTLEHCHHHHPLFWLSLCSAPTTLEIPGRGLTALCTFSPAILLQRGGMPVSWH